MNNGVTVWIIIAISLVLFGSVLFVSVLAVNNWEFNAISTERFEDNIHDINDDFDKISLDTDTADINFVLSDEGKCRVLCHENVKMKHTVEVLDNTLVIGLSDDRKWYDYITILSFDTAKITVELPKNQYVSVTAKTSTGDITVPEYFTFETVDINGSTNDVIYEANATGSVKIKISTGDIKIKNITAVDLDLKVSTGDIIVSSAACTGNVKAVVSTGKTKFDGVDCNGFESDGSTGDISLKDVVVTEKLSIRRSTGDVRFENSDAGEIYVKTDTGDVKGSLLSEKVFFAETDTGKVTVPKTMTGGKCEITTDTGDIKIEIA